MATLKEKVDRGVDKAFAKIDSLLVDAVFSKKSVSGFDLAAGETTETPGETQNKRVFESSKIIRSSEGPVKINTILFRSDGQDYNVYDTVTILGREFRVVVANDDGYSVTAEVTRA